MIGNFTLRISGGKSLNPGSLNDDARRSSTRRREIKPEVNKPMGAIRNLGAAVAWLICSAAMAYAQTPTIVSAIVNSATQQITITGVSLTPATGAPVVKLNSMTLTLVSSSSTLIVADLPTGLAAGTYRLIVNNGSATPGVFDVTNGAVGPQGPAGPAGGNRYAAVQRERGGRHQRRLQHRQHVPGAFRDRRPRRPRAFLDERKWR